MLGQIRDLISVHGPVYSKYWKKQNKQKQKNTRTITHVCIPVLLFILFAQKQVCNVACETDSIVA